MSWLLPEDLPSAELPAGRYGLPWAHGRADQDRLIALVQRLSPRLRHRVHLPWAALDLQHPLQRPGETLVVVDLVAGVAPERLLEALERLGGAVQLLRPAQPEPGEGGWQALHLRAAVVRGIKACVEDPRHPLAPLGLAHLPVDFAAGLTEDVIGLLDLLEAAVAHRLQFSHLGLDPEEWRESLQRVAGRWLAERLQRLTGPDLRAALAVLVAGPTRLAGLDEAAAGAAALARLGLAQVEGERVRLGPLAQRLDDPFIRGAFLDRVPADAWSEPARRLVVAGEMAPPRGAPPPELVVARSGDLLWRAALDALDGERARLDPQASPAAQVAARDGLQVVRELSRLPSYLEVLPDDLAARIVGGLRAAEPYALDGTPLSRLLHLVTALLRFLSARSLDQQPLRAQAALSVDLLVRPDDPEGFRLARGAVNAELAWEQLLTAADWRALDQVAERSERLRLQLPATSAAALSLLGIEALVAQRRGQPERAAALQAERLAAYTALGAEREVAVVRARLARLAVARGDLERATAEFTESLVGFEALGAAHDAAVVQGDLARLKAEQGQIHRALQLHRQRLKTLTRLGARRGRAQAQADIGRLLARERRFDEALVLLRAAKTDFSALRDARALAALRADVGRILAARGEFDEAISRHRQVLRAAQALADEGLEATARLALGELELQRAARAQGEAGHLQHLRAARAELGAAYRLAQRAESGEVLGEAAAAYTSVLISLGAKEDAHRFVATAAGALAAVGQEAVHAALQDLVSR